MFYFDVRLNEWKNPRSSGSVPVPRSYAGMSATNDKIFMYGGYDGRQQFGGIHVYDMLDDRWEKMVALGEKPTSRMNHSLTFVPPHHLILFGGRKHTHRQNDVSLFDISTSTWKMLRPNSNANDNSKASSGPSTTQATTITTTAPVGRTAHSVVHYEFSSSRTARTRNKKPTQERLLLFGGYAGNLTWLNDLQLLSIPREVFRTVPRMDDAAAHHQKTRAAKRKPTRKYRVLWLYNLDVRLRGTDTFFFSLSFRIGTRLVD